MKAEKLLHSYFFISFQLFMQLIYLLNLRGGGGGRWRGQILIQLAGNLVKKK